MKKLQYKVNIIPVVGKADCCTKIEIAAFKTKVTHILSSENLIKISLNKT